ncbi:MAG TPA: citrate synthase [Terriglobales bacterium]|nr:citrate synthase [Terriglobales bacterium]
MSTTTPTSASRGLEDVVAGTSSICYIDGKKGILAYRGIDIHDLAEVSTFEEVTYLLWHGKLPSRKELADFTLQSVRERKLDAQIISYLRQVPKHAIPMDVIRTMVSALSFFDPEEAVNTKEANYNKSLRLFSQVGMIVASYDRIRKGLPLIEPDRSLNYAGNFLLMLNGKRPSETAIRALDTSLILTADHEWNASTFAARVTAATLSDMHSAITSGIGALKGPLHGGANEAVMKLLNVIEESGADPVEYVKGMVAQKVKIPGFGHRVYTTEDPRATHLRQMSRDLGYSSGHPKWYENSKAIEEWVNKEKKLNANVDFYSASVYHMLGIDVDLFTPLFVMSRTSGWTAHVMEQLSDNRLIRPRAEYIGPTVPQKYVPLDQRK